MGRDPNIVTSGLSGPVVEQGIRVSVEIYRLEHDTRWTLEVVNAQGTSIVWDDGFETDDDAYRAFRATVEEKGMTAFLDATNVVPLPGRR